MEIARRRVILVVFVLFYPIVERTEQQKLEGQNVEREGARGTT